MMVFSWGGGRIWAKISARGRAIARVELNLRSWMRSPRRPSRGPAMKVGGRSWQLGQRPSAVLDLGLAGDLGVLQFGQKFWW